MNSATRWSTSPPTRNIGAWEALTRSPAAVLGFRNLSGRPDAGWISTALAELVSRELSAASDVLRLVPAEEAALARVR